jgi:zinc protease
MKPISLGLLLVLGGAGLAGFTAKPAVTAEPPATTWKVPIQEKTLSNGLRVVVSEDHAAPTFGLCVTYGIGFRLEPEGRTGFAHLFEHMMFEGTPVAPKGTFDRVTERGGGWNNGDTRWDFTEYITSAPISALQPMLWLEADRMKTLDFSPANLDNQRKVVEEEVRVNMLNQPYGLFFAIDLPEKAFHKYPNAHNFYGDFRDLDAATIENVKSFYQNYYAPNNAVLTVSGDVNAADVFAGAAKYFGALPRRDVPPRPDTSEPPQTAEQRFSESDHLAKQPGLAIGYRMPDHDSADAIVAAVTGELLHNGDASLLYQALVKQKKVALSVNGGLNWPLGNPYFYGDPTLMTTFVIYPSSVKEQALLDAYDQTVHQLATAGPSQAELDRVRAKMLSDWYGELEIPVERASSVGQAALLAGGPEKVNDIASELSAVTPERVRAFAARYLVPAGRTIINRAPSAATKTGTKGDRQ